MLLRREFLARSALLGSLVSQFCVTPTRRDPFFLSATVDFPDVVGSGPYNLELLDQLMETMVQMGVRRVYWLYYGDVERESYWAGNLFDYMEYGRQTLDNLGEPVRAAVPVAHRHGLELYGVLPLDPLIWHALRSSVEITTPASSARPASGPAVPVERSRFTCTPKPFALIPARAS